MRLIKDLTTSFNHWRDERTLKRNCRHGNSPIVRCKALSCYLLDNVSETISDHDLHFYRICLRTGSAKDCITFLEEAVNDLIEKGYVRRTVAVRLDDVIETSPISISAFLGLNDRREVLKRFLKQNHRLCIELEKQLGSNTRESKHSLNLTKSYIDALELCLKTMAKMA